MEKYCGKWTIKNWGKPAIWLNNKDPREDLPDWKRDWLNANCVVVYLNHQIWLPELMAVDPTPPPPSPLPQPEHPPTPTPVHSEVPSEDYFRYFDQAANEEDIAGRASVGVAQHTYQTLVRQRAIELRDRDAFNGLTTIQADSQRWEFNYDRWVGNVNRILDLRNIAG